MEKAGCFPARPEKSYRVNEHHRMSGCYHRIPSQELGIDHSLCCTKMERIPEALQFPVIIKGCGALTGEP